MGGIRVKVHTFQSAGSGISMNAATTLLYENTIKFSAIVGKSVLRVSKGFVAMGATRKLGQVFTGYFTVANATTLLPLKYSISSTKSVVLFYFNELLPQLT